MNIIEQSLSFDCRGEQLLGIHCALSALPAAAAVAVVIVTGGPQYRAGSHRQFVLLARALAAAGIASLRFDLRGMGDSTGEDRSFDDRDDDIEAAVSALAGVSGHPLRVILWGLCDGASAALLYCARRADKRISGLCLVNPWLRSPESQAETQLKHYYRRRLMQKEFWLKMLSGAVAGRAIKDLATNIGLVFRRPASVPMDDFRVLMAKGFRSFQGPVMLCISGDDYTAREFIDQANARAEWGGLLQGPNVSRFDLALADHTFSEPAQRVALEAGVVEWLQRSFDRCGPGGRVA